MQLILIKSFAVVLLAILFWQDLQDRAVSVVLFPLLLFCFIGVGLTNNAYQAGAWLPGLNLVFLLVQMGILYGYFWLTRGKQTPVFGTVLGWGDILFWLVTCVLFSPANYIVFFLSSLLFSLLLHLVIGFVFTGTNKVKVPLAGHQAFFLLILIACQYCIPTLDFYNDDLVLNYVL